MKRKSRVNGRRFGFVLAFVFVCLSYGAAGLVERSASAQVSSAKPDALIAFVSNRNGIYGDIYVMNPDGGDQRNVTNSPSTSEVCPSFSPDGRRIAFLRDWKTLFVMNADGSGQTRLTNNTKFDHSPA